MSTTPTINTRRAFLRVIAAGSGLVGASGLLSACGVATPSVPNAPVVPPLPAVPVATMASSDVQTITFSYYDTSFQKMIDAFEATHPHIRVKLTPGNDIESALLRLIERPDVPDVCAIASPWIGTFAQKGGLADLAAAPYDAIRLRNDFSTAAWSEGLTAEGRLIGMPLSTSPGSLWYRKDLLDAAGITSEPLVLAERIKTWDDLFGLAQELKRATPDVSLLVNPLQDVFGPMVAQQGNNLIKGDQVLIVEKCTLPALKAVEARKLKLDADLGSGMFNGVGTEAMLAGKLAGIAAQTWMQGFISERFSNTIGKWRVLPPPSGPYSSYTLFLAIPEQSQKKEIAWEFVTYCCGTVEGQNAFLKTLRDLPAYMPSWKDPVYDQPVPLFGDQAVYRLLADIAATAPAGKPSPYDREIADLLYPKIRDAVAKGTSGEQAVLDAEAAVIAKFPNLRT